MHKIKKPNFLCVGAQKAGTTTLHDILNQHPNIYLPKSKEAHFFDIDEHYERGINWWKQTFFSDHKNEKIIGAITPEYLYYEEVPQRILDTLGKDIKIIIILRNPVNRAYSHYLMSKKRGYENHSFDEAISLESERIKKGEFEKNHFSYMTRGLYLEQIKRYQHIFSEKNILILRFEDDFLKNKEQTINKVLTFLEIEGVSFNINIKSNKATRPIFKTLTRLVYEDGKIKKLLRFFVKSSKFKIIISKFIDNINQSTKGIESLSENEKNDLINKFFLKDIIDLEKHLNITLRTWYKK